MNRDTRFTASRHMCRYIAIQPHVVSSKVSRYLGRDTIRVSRSHVSRCIDASMHRYTPIYKVSTLDALSTHPAVLKTLLTYLQGQHAYVLSTLHHFVYHRYDSNTDKHRVSVCRTCRASMGVATSSKVALSPAMHVLQNAKRAGRHPPTNLPPT